MTDEHTAPRRRLSEILDGGNRDELARQWDDTQPAQEFAPLPRGAYVARVVSGELSQSQKGTPGYKLTFRVLEGEHAGRQVWHDLWLTATALPMTKRDLAKLGITALDQLEQPLPLGIRVEVEVVLREDNDGIRHNRVRSFKFLGIDDAPMVDSEFGPQQELASDGSEGEQPTLVATATPDDNKAKGNEA